MNKQLERTLALAGIFQAASLVSDLAQKGYTDDDSVKVSLTSLLKLESSNTLDIYGDIKGLQRGLKSLINTFSKKNQLKPDPVIRYVLSLMHLERKLINNKPMCDKIATGIKRAQSQSEYLDLMHPNVIANFANLYTDTLSTFPFRVQVVGEQAYLSRLEVIHKVRALLLAGVRSAVLWRQLQGSRLHLLFGKRRNIQYAQSLLNDYLARNKLHG